MIQKTLVVGFVFVDIKGFAENGYNPQGRNLGEIRFIHGGVSRNVAENIAVCGMPVAFASLTEDSALGHDVVRRLNAVGADTQYMETVKHAGIGTWMVILDAHGDVAGQISCPPDTAALEDLVRRRGEEMVRECDRIILEIDTSAVIDEIILGYAEQYGKPVYTVVGNLSVIKTHPEYVRALDCFVCNEIEAGEIFGQDLTEASPDMMLGIVREKIGALGCRAIVVTMGARGAVYYETDRMCGGMVPAIPTELVDSTGAGDAFLSGMVMGLSRGMTLSRAVEVGTYLAHETIQTTESCTKADKHFWEKF